jgi:hypothetical protein
MQMAGEIRQLLQKPKQEKEKCVQELEYELRRMKNEAMKITSENSQTIATNMNLHRVEKCED